MNFELNAILSLTAGIAAVASGFKLKEIDRSFLPFVLLLWIAFFTELINISVIYGGFSNMRVYNTYVLLEGLILVCLFWRWKLIEKNKGYLIQLIFIALWLTESIINKFSAFNSIYIITYSFAIIFLAIHMLNRLIYSINDSLWKNAKFLICIGVFLFFSYSVIVECFWFYGLNRTTWLRNYVYYILVFINAFTNLLFAFAILWVPKKLKFIIPS